MALLEYSPQPAVGDVIVDRSGDATIVILNGSFKRVLRPAATAAVVPVIGAILLLTTDMGSSSRTLNFVWVAVLVLVTTGAVAKGVFIALQPVRWTIGANGVLVRLKTPSRIVEQLYPRIDFTDVRVERVKLKTMLLRRPALIAVRPDGGRVAHCFASRPELAFMADAFRRGLGLDDDPLGENAFAPLPRRSRIARRVGLHNVAVGMKPPVIGKIGWAFLAVAVPTILIGCGKLSENWSKAVPASLYILLLIFGILPIWLPLAAIHAVRRRILIELTADTLTLNEKAFLRPAHESWPLARIRSIALDGGLFVNLIDDLPAPLLTFGRPADLRAIHDTLQVGLQRARSAPRPV
jgi:hypothetical protein